MRDKERIIPKEMAFVIIYDADAGMFCLKQKDCTYWTESFRWHYNFFGTGLVPLQREKSSDALKRKLAKEMPNIERKVTGGMRFWKTFCLPWGRDVDGEYTAHVHVFMVGKYEMMDLVDDAGSAGTKRGSLAYISTTRVEQMIAHRDFMGSLHVVAEEFLKKVGEDPALFWDQLKK